MAEDREDPAADAESWTWLPLVFCLVLLGAAVVWVWKMWPT